MSDDVRQSADATVNAPRSNDLARLRWRCRRGMKELDILLERYLKQRFSVAPDAEQSRFVRLLDCEDPELWVWLIGHEAPPVEFSDVIQRLRAGD